MKYIVALLLFIVPSCVIAQKYSMCYVYQYQGGDTVSSHQVLKKKMNRHGKAEVEYCNGYKEFVTSDPEYYTKNYYYTKDTLLKQTITYGVNGYKIFCSYHYNSKRQNTHMKIAFVEKLSLTHTSGKKTKYRKKHHSECLYDYDNRGNVVKVRLTKPLPVMEDSYKRTWAYDDSNRMKKEIEFDNNGDSLSVDSFIYSEGGYTCLQQFFPLNDGRVDTFIYKTDANHKLVEKQICSFGHLNAKRIMYSYNAAGDLKKEEILDLNDRTSLVHLYYYE